MKDIEIRQTWKCDACGAFEEDKYVPSNRTRLVASVPPHPEGWSEFSIHSTAEVDIKADLCPKCTRTITKYKGDGIKSLLATTSLLFNIRPVLAVDAVVIRSDKVLLIKRKNEPKGWAFAGGFVDPSESTGDAVLRELKEETGLEATKAFFISHLDAPDRDPRFHVVSMVYFIENFIGDAKAADDALELDWLSLDQLPSLEWAFPDHYSIAASLLRNLAELGINELCSVLKGENNV